MASSNNRLTPKLFIGGAVFGVFIRATWYFLQRQSVPGFSNLSSENLAPQTLGLFISASFFFYGVLYFILALSDLKTERNFVYRASERIGWFDKIAFGLLAITAGQFLTSAVIGIISWLTLLRAEPAYRFVTDLMVVLLCIFLTLMLPSLWFPLNESDLRNARWSNPTKNDQRVSFFAEVLIAGLLILTAIDLFRVVMSAG